MTREEIEQLNGFEPYCIETDREQSWYEFGLVQGLETADANPKSPWISVKDDLPSFHSDLVENAIATKNVIVLLNDGRIRETQLLCGHWKEYDKKVTHWMPILEPPKE
ncbi:DUF551 domain-containing protein [Ruminococcus sp.]|uniref:DUF551 domain-containing protein n=1 Tax=Ruminococcus sp. TaxID=41978 RepID=UPI003EFD32EA